MQPNPRKSRSWSVAGAFLTLLALGWCAPRPAEAGCDHRADRPGFAIEPALAAAAFAPDASPAAPRPKPAPCDGPQCSGKSAPPASTVPPPPPRAELWGLAPRVDPDDRPDSTRRAVEDAPARPVRQAAAIFHPPRRPR